MGTGGRGGIWVLPTYLPGLSRPDPNSKCFLVITIEIWEKILEFAWVFCRTDDLFLTFCSQTQPKRIPKISPWKFCACSPVVLSRFQIQKILKFLLQSLCELRKRQDDAFLSIMLKKISNKIFFEHKKKNLEVHFIIRIFGSFIAHEFPSTICRSVEK